MLAAKSLLESLASRASHLLANEGNLPHHELEKQLKHLLQNALGKLDLVSRDEFDGQMLVLQRTRQRLEALESRVQELEQQLAGPEQQE
ncbi:accessory factor UbiK family protein [Thiopseudomonas denitrificans]|uniref:Ubiquinone biosynthesis accessory factor UbiK n=1 Tax=Thiopseudomonas denitrificans TaxID=1501432 RepID=A0A4R6TWI3_9GAMM|nr:accessory factor UbiK family protein [Thiopseudomonas denitrificans]TDQ37092.1 hypothetical protein DFQ45_10992 [Thiopseudomonas denitrificans]